MDGRNECYNGTGACVYIYLVLLLGSIDLIFAAKMITILGVGPIPLYLTALHVIVQSLVDRVGLL